MADLVLSSVLQVITDKITTFVQEKFENLLNIKEDMEKLQCTLPMVQAVLEDAEAKQATKPAVRIWLSKLKEAAYEAEGLLLLLSADSSLQNRRKYADKVKVTLNLLEKAVDEGLCFNFGESTVIVHEEWESRRETSSFVTESDVYGREEDKEEIVKLLLSGEATQGGAASCIPIIGMGGLGKTTVAQLAYNDQKVIQNFDVKVWVFVSHHFDVKKIITTIIESITNDKCHLSSMDALHSKVLSLLRNKRYLIVLDDVWTEDQDDWDKLRPLFRGGLDGSRILITTRSRKVAFQADLPSFPYYLKELPEDACWSLFAQRAFERGEEEKHPTLLPIGQQIVRKCGGLALAAKTLGSLMRLKREVREWMFVRDSELWNLEECESGILPALKLSYSHLPLRLKRCLSFCSIFPRSFEFKKEKLIHLWMAEGFIQSSSSNTRRKPEDIGNDYFTDLEWMSFFQEIKQCENGVVAGYKLHDVIYDLVQSVTSSEYTMLNRDFSTPTSFRRIRHSSVVCDFRSPSIPEELYEGGYHLRTLIIYSEGNLHVLPNKFYSCLKCLFVLDLSGSGLIKLESSIGGLSHLTYLDLSHTPVLELPPQIEGLHSLQTLNVFNCYNLLELPDLRKMRSLRHLNNEGCRKLVRMLKTEGRDGLKIEIGRNQLQTLSLFVVGGITDFEFLRHLKLQGSLKVTQLETVERFQRNLILGVNLQNGIKSLGLYWGSDDGCSNINPERESILSRFQERKQTESSGPSQWIRHDPSKGEKVLGSLQLPHYLKTLLIIGYPGSRFPNWHDSYLKMAQQRQRLPDISDIQNELHFRLFGVRIFVKPPTFGELRYLSSLTLRKMRGLRLIGEEFYSNTRPHAVAGRSDRVAHAREEINFCRPFSELIELVLVDLPNLEEWSSPNGYKDAFPNLRKLILNKCPKLTVMPEIFSLHHLDLRDCRAALLHYFRNLRSLETLVIEGVEDLSNITASFLISNPLLRTLEIKSCPQLSSLPDDLENLAALKSLVIRWCGKLNSLPRSLQYLSALESLEIGDCQNLTSLPDGDNRGLSNLRSLSIENCNNLKSVSMGFQHLTCLEILTIMYCPSIFELPRSVEHLSSLRSLSILWCQQLTFLPEEFENLIVLHSLEIRGCPGLEVLPEWIGRLVSLRSLVISDCHGIKFLPEGIEHLTALQHLTIQDCPQLQQRCRPESGEYWPKIAHVPYKRIELPKLKRPREEGSSSSNQ